MWKWEGVRRVAAADKIDGLGTAVPEIHPRNPRRGQNWPQNAGKSKFEIQLMAWPGSMHTWMMDPYSRCIFPFACESYISAGQSDQTPS